MREEIPIDDDVPLPPEMAQRHARPAIYPLAKMGVGQSFEVQLHQVASVRAMAVRYEKKLGRTFVVRPLDGKYRCWRIK